MKGLLSNAYLVQTSQAFKIKLGRSFVCGSDSRSWFGCAELSSDPEDTKSCPKLPLPLGRLKVGEVMTTTRSSRSPGYIVPASSPIFSDPAASHSNRLVALIGYPRTLSHY